MSNPTTLTVPQAAERLGVTASQVRQLREAGQLTGEKIGRDWHISAASVEAYAAKPKHPGGRPRKRPAAQTIPEEVLEKIREHRPHLGRMIDNLREHPVQAAQIEKSIAVNYLRGESRLTAREMWDLSACSHGKAYGDCG